MFQSLHSLYSKFSKPSSFFWLNSWAYSNVNSWLFLSYEMLTFYISSIKGFNVEFISQSFSQPNILYIWLITCVILAQVGLLIG